MTTSNDIANRAIMMMGGNQPAVTGVAPTFDSSTNGVALSRLYYSTVRTVMRQFSWDFSRNIVSLTLTGNVAPFPYIYEYAYPTNAVQVWQLTPATLADANNPLPINWSVANAIVGSNQTRVIHTNLQNAQAVIDNFPSENTWDDLFTEATVRLLASNLALATAGKPDLSKDLLESGGGFESIGQERDS